MHITRDHRRSEWENLIFFGIRIKPHAMVSYG